QEIAPNSFFVASYHADSTCPPLQPFGTVNSHSRLSVPPSLLSTASQLGSVTVQPPNLPRLSQRPPHTPETSSTSSAKTKNESETRFSVLVHVAYADVAEVT